jgi:hypothetical protein
MKCSYLHGYRLTLPRPTGNDASEPARVPTCGHYEQLIRILDYPSGPRSFTAHTPQQLLGDHRVLGYVFPYRPLAPSRRGQQITVLLGEHQDVGTAPGNIVRIEDSAARQSVRNGCEYGLGRVVVYVDQAQCFAAKNSHGAVAAIQATLNMLFG